MKTTFISVMLVALLAGAAYGGFDILTRNGSEAQLISPPTTQPDSPDEPVSENYTVAAQPAAQQRTATTTTTTTVAPTVKPQTEDEHCLGFVLQFASQAAVKTPNHVYSGFGAAIEYLKPGETVQFTNVSGSSGCIIGKTEYPEQPDNLPTDQPVDNFCYQTTKTFEAVPAKTEYIVFPDGSTYSETEYLVAALTDLENSEAIVFADINLNIGCVYGKTDGISAASVVRADKETSAQPIDKYCFETFKANAAARQRTIARTFQDQRDESEWTTLLGEVIKNLPTGESLLIGGASDGSSGCVIRKTATR